MNTLFVVVRAIHFASVMLLFGQLWFAICIAKPPWSVGQGAVRNGGNDAEIFRWSMRVAVLGLCVSIPSAIAWLAIEAAGMSGKSAVDSTTLGLVLGETAFGRVWASRLAIGFALSVLVPATIAASNPNRQSRLATAALGLAAAYVGTLAWTGHATGGSSGELIVHLSADVIHLLAGSAWIGALPGLAFAFGREHRSPSAGSLESTAALARRFSVFGVAIVSAIVLSGAVNGWYLVGDAASLFGTEYGRLLVVKVSLVVAMIALALWNRQHLVPGLEARDRSALGPLRRNAVLEIVAGCAVVTLVGLLGITVPAAHQEIAWPFAYRLDLDVPSESVAAGIGLIGVALAAIVAAGIVARGIQRERPRVWISGTAGMILAACCGIALLAVPAPSTTYLTSPVAYTTASIAQGAASYARECSGCHGARGRGEGVNRSAGSTQAANLIEHIARRPAGDFYWSIARGIPGTPMPAFSPRLTDAEIWRVIQFLRAESAAEIAVPMFGSVNPWRPVEAPDFTLEAGSRAQESLRQIEPNAITVLVLYALPKSLQRVAAIVAAEPVFAKAGARVIAVPLPSSSVGVDAIDPDKAILATTAPDVASVYSMFARSRADGGNSALEHVEFLIDRQGYVRARWLGVPAEPGQTARMLAQIELLKRERPRKAGAWGHAH